MEAIPILNFLKELKRNNNRKWFNENKPKYQEAKKQFEDMVKQFIPEVAKIDNSIDILEPKDCVFRIYRDVRFSKDKSPYKENFGAVFAKGGRKSPYAGYYLHIEPGASFIGGGLHMPPSDILKIARKEVFDYTEEFKEIISQQSFTDNFQTIMGEKLKRAPRDFPNEFPDIELLKYKSYTIGKNVSDEIFQSPGAMNEITATFAAMQPFISFFNRAIAFHQENN